MPPRTRRTDAGPEGVPSPEELEQVHTEDPAETSHAEDVPGDPGAADMAQAPETLIYEGEILTTGMTLAVLLPGDNRESYFPVKFTGRLQPGEDPQDLANRAITVVRETVIGQIDDAIDAMAEYTEELQKRLGK